jgi:aminodeoxyfutalosine synthase
MLRLRELQDETGGFRNFIPFPFQPNNTALEDTITRTTVWDDLRTIAISRLMLDNFKYIKAYWVMLTLPVAQLALGFGANDLDGTVSEERIMHAADVKSSKSLSSDNLVEAIRQAGRIPVERDSEYNVVQRY